MLARYIPHALHPALQLLSLQQQQLVVVLKEGTCRAGAGGLSADETMCGAGAASDGCGQAWRCRAGMAVQGRHGGAGQAWRCRAGMAVQGRHGGVAA